jgi:signal transduction histidine kinase
MVDHDREKSAPPPPIPELFAGRSWRRTWFLTAAMGTALLLSIFGGYELIEREWLTGVWSDDALHVAHIVRGMGSAVLLGTLAFLLVWRARRRAEGRLREAYGELEAAFRERSDRLAREAAFRGRLFDALQSQVVVVDRKGKVVEANRVALDACGEKLIGASIGSPCTVLGGSCQGETCVATQALKTGRPIVGEFTRTNAATGRIFAIDAYPVPSPSGGPPDVVIEVLRDITDQKRFEAASRDQERLAAVGVLAAGIAHDIANPLASMSSELELLEIEIARERGRVDRSSSPKATDLARISESIRVVRGEAERIRRALRDMTDFARRRNEDQTLVPVGVAIEDAVRMVRHDVRARRVRFHVELAKDLPPVKIVEDHLVSVIVNLLLNALDAMPDGGDLTITAEAVGRFVHVSVKDSGHGMSEDVLRRATEPLFTTKQAGRGTGLGLSISADVMRAAGGSLDIESAPGLGTTVHLTCPAVSHA